MNFKLPFLFVLLFVCSAMSARSSAPGNDHCTKAMLLKNVTNFCSAPRQFTNFEATPGGPDPANCFPQYLLGDTDNDVWFKFTAIASVVNIRVIGAIRTNPGGTLQYPQVALYRGDCKELYEVGCISDGQGYNIVETFISNLVVGQNYFIRVDARNQKTGSFQLCVNNFNPVPSPSSDCSTAVVLCDKSGFAVPSMSTAGTNKSELPKGICVPEESQSAWYKWTCGNSGTLTFKLTPNKPSDDLDFVLFILPNGVTDCSMKIPVRCMAAGENLGAPYSNWMRCSGPTGLTDGSTDIVEDQGCDENNDSYLAPLRMEAGKSYALMVNNYQNTGNGFSVEFGGSGSLVGPVAHFTLSKLTVATGEKLTIKNASTFAGGIKNWEWNFGVDAKPQKAKGQGPHTVSYSSSGKKSITLSIQTDNGCKVTKLRNVEVTAGKANPPKSKPAKPKVEPAKPAPPKPEPPKAEPIVVETVMDAETTISLPPTEEPAAPITESSGGPQTDEALPESSLEFSLPTESMDTVKTENQATASWADTTWTEVTYLVNFIATVYFKADSSALQLKDLETLDKVVEMLDENPRYLAHVEGHTNNLPSDDYAKKLSMARADATMAYLITKGVDPQRLTRMALGKKQVVTKEKDHTHRKLNQRVEVKLMVRKE